ncbi:MAG: nucleoside hydrolase [Candidatus Azobacteroides sp.]|nr:nucleoside hydrolase [Candidatus Azobacteroides sp.]
MKNLIYMISMLFLLVACTEKNNEVKEESGNKKVKMILDLDTGIDDALALAYALAHPDIELIGVMASFGNVTMEESVTNTLALLDMLNHAEVPVFKGADRATGEKEPFHVLEISRLIHGKNGIGDVNVSSSPRTANKQDGVDFMIESARKYGKDLMIVAVGPTTNLNEAIKKEPALKNLVGKVVIMGGALIVDGNVNKYAEANIYQDPVAANELFTSGTPLTMVGLDVTQRTKLTKKDTQIWRNLGTTSGKIFADMVDYYIEAYNITSPRLNGCALHDPLAVAVAVDPDLVKILTLHMRVGTSQEDWGRTIGINEKMNDPDPNVSVCVDVEVDEFVTRFMDLLSQLFKAN